MKKMLEFQIITSDDGAYCQDTVKGLCTYCVDLHCSVFEALLHVDSSGRPHRCFLCLSLQEKTKKRRR